MAREPGARLRTIEVRSPSSRAETLAVVRAAFVLLFGGLLAIRSPFGASRAGRDAVELLPYQKLFRDLAPPEQRMFRELQEGLIEVESFRSSRGRWPKVEELAELGVPPFAPSPLDGEAYAWSLRERDLLVNYLGLPRAGAKRSPFMLLVQGPGDHTPGEGQVDEQHHALASGQIIHVSIWSRGDLAPNLEEEARVVDLPMAEGWTQILVGASPGPRE